MVSGSMDPPLVLSKQHSTQHDGDRCHSISGRGKGEAVQNHLSSTSQPTSADCTLSFAMLQANSTRHISIEQYFSRSAREEACRERAPSMVYALCLDCQLAKYGWKDVVSEVAGLSIRSRQACLQTCIYECRREHTCHFYTPYETYIQRCYLQCARSLHVHPSQGNF